MAAALQVMGEVAGNLAMRAPVFNDAWPEDVRAVYAHDMQEIWDRNILPNVWNQYHNQLDLYLAIAGDGQKDILDIGCAQATLALMLAERGHRVTAVDLRPSFLEYARSRYTHGDIRFFVRDAIEEDIPGEYDLVYANQIIEHIVYPEKLARKLFSLLRPGGVAIVTTPNWHYLKNNLPSFRELGSPEDWVHLQNTADGDGHFYAYSQQELKEAIHAGGFDDVSVSCFETPFISGHMRVRHLHRWVPYGLLKCFDGLMLKLPWIRKRLSHQLLCVATKRANETSDAESCRPQAEQN